MRIDDKLERVIEELGTDETLMSLVKALSTDELNDNLNYIARMWDTSTNELEDVIWSAYEHTLEEKECLLNDLSRALSHKELNDNLDYIIRMWDIEL